MREEQDSRTVDRRRLLRGAGTVAAGIAGTGVVGAVAASPAQAIPGDPVVQGADNNAVNATTLRSASDNATLRLANSKTIPANGFVMAAPALRLAPSADTISDQAEVGSLSMDTGGNIWAITGEFQGLKIANYVHSSGNSNTIVPITPQRVIDTRSSALRARIVNASGNLDSSGRVLAGRTIHISLEDFVFFGDATFGNVTVTGALNSGFLTVFPYGVSRPATSTINYQTMQTLANAFMTGIGFDFDYISVYTQSTTHVILDVVSFVISIGLVNPAVLATPAMTGLTAESAADRAAQRAVAAKQRKPSWK